MTDLFFDGFIWKSYMDVISESEEAGEEYARRVDLLSNGVKAKFKKVDVERIIMELTLRGQYDQVAPLLSLMFNFEDETTIKSRINDELISRVLF